MIGEVVGRNIFRLRQIAGLNQKEAALKAGISRPAFAAIEKGEADPRSETLHKIAGALGVPIRELFVEMPELKYIRFRMSRITEQKKRIREQEIIKIARWLKDYNYLERILGEKLEYQLASIKSKDPEKAAAKVREKLNIGPDGPIADITDVIFNAGIKLHFSVLPLDSFFGLSIGKEDGGPAISINTASHISIERQIFTAAHEMAHLILHKESFKGDLLEDDANEEKEANVFASYFLMPQKSFITALEKYRDLPFVDMVLNVKRYFKVSYKTVLMRLIHEEMVNQSIYKRFNIGIKNKYGISLKDHHEPDALTTYYDYIAVQEPEGIRKSEIISKDRVYSLVRKAFEQDRISISRAAEILNKSQMEMRELAVSWEEFHWER